MDDTRPDGDMSAVVVHDGAIHPGGAVRVVLEAAEALDADLVVGVSGMDKTWWESRAPNDVRVLSRSSKMGTLQDVRNAYRMLKLDLRNYETVLTSGPATKFYQPYDQQTHVHYLHHPPLSKLWYDGGLFAYAQSIVDRLETTSIPVVLANSDLTADRYWKHYGERVDAVVNPPVDTEAFTPREEYTPGRLVLVGRLEGRKRPELAVEAFERLSSGDFSFSPELHVVGDGPLESRLQGKAGENVTFHGFLDDDELRTVVESAHAGVFLAEREDFGITPVEYMAAGLPVLGVDEPNTNNQIENGETGILVAPDPESVATGMRSVLTRDWDRKAIADSAGKYRASRFRDEIQTVVHDV